MHAIIRGERGRAAASLWRRHEPSCGLAVSPRHWYLYHLYIFDVAAALLLMLTLTVPVKTKLSHTFLGTSVQGFISVGYHPPLQLV